LIYQPARPLQGTDRQTKTFETRAEAEQWARAVEVEMDKGAFVSRAEAESTTLRELLERYLEEVTLLKNLFFRLHERNTLLGLQQAGRNSRKQLTAGPEIREQNRLDKKAPTFEDSALMLQGSEPGSGVTTSRVAAGASILCYLVLLTRFPPPPNFAAMSLLCIPFTACRTMHNASLESNGSGAIPAGSRVAGRQSLPEERPAITNAASQDAANNPNRSQPRAMSRDLEQPTLTFVSRLSSSEQLDPKGTR
jgi:hypothetical protein